MSPSPLHRLRFALCLGVCLFLPLQAMAAPARAEDSADQAQVRQLLMSSFDKPEARLQVDPIVVRGEHALAGWTQGERGGRALLRRHGQAWRISVCGGDGLKDPKALADAGVPVGEARRLAQDLDAAESRLPVGQRARFSTFDGLVRMDAPGQSPAHGAAH